ncbi:hypothetical protein EDD18DRAFT_1355765 [Armillaria luteobubalina]|uniref:Uncharacterized protein n=1 Tax=Armillaria luteobubalina TaxID=153913 RepID=A0AA39Q219_9AGAR|nr:hypothetical protein EDD18DRAFT_1355765 [Armillaria luteobubalina]
MEGGVLGFVAKYLGGPRALAQLLAGPSILMTRFYKFHCHDPLFQSKEDLMQETFTFGEARAIYGFLEQYDSAPRSMLPTDAILKQHFPPATRGWNLHCTKFLTHVLEHVHQGIAEPLTENGWKDYMYDWMFLDETDVGHRVTKQDSDYGQSLINLAYPESWKTVKLTKFRFPEEYLEDQFDID